MTGILSGKNIPANSGNTKDMGSTPRLWRSPEGGHGNPLQYSCLENPMDRGAWWVTVHRVAKSWTWLKQLNTLIQYDWCPYTKRQLRHRHEQMEGHVKTQREGGCLQPKDMGLQRNQNCWHFDLWLPASITVRKLISFA